MDWQSRCAPHRLVQRNNCNFRPVRLQPQCPQRARSRSGQQLIEPKLRLIGIARLFLVSPIVPAPGTTLQVHDETHGPVQKSDPLTGPRSHLRFDALHRSGADTERRGDSPNAPHVREHGYVWIGSSAPACRVSCYTTGA